MASPAISTQATSESAQPYYATGEHLRAKHAQIHNQSGRAIEQWARQLVPIEATTHILDAGCGWGRFSWPLLEGNQLPAANLVCADASLGMVQSAKQEGENRGQRPHFVTCGIEALPFPARHFDGVMANFVLYHVEPLAQGVAELARVLKADGWLLVAAHGITSVPVVELHYQALDRLGIPYTPEAPTLFDLENGTALLAQHFGHIERYDFIDEELCPSAEAFTQKYRTIGRYREVLGRPDVADQDKAALPLLFCELAKGLVQADGVIHLPVVMGAFVCTEPQPLT
ncbi:MAG: class I SAM-dependent methyltransferase [Caldilinea sp. CFX5]|nr:class I SAM-dependent methyltransferase [Caldilinea sp. CFX5]